MSFIYEQESVRFTASPNQAYHARQQGIPGVRRHHVLSRAWTFDAPVDADRLCNAYLKVCRVHPMLRASFAPGGDTYMVQPCQAAVRAIDDQSVLSTDSVQVEPIGGHAAELLIGRHAVRLSVSHAVCDRRSFELTVHEISRAYARRALEPEEAPYADYVSWLTAKRLVALHDRLLGERTAELRTAKWPPRPVRHPSTPSAFSSAVRTGCSCEHLQTGCRSRGMTVTGALLEAAGTALSEMVPDLPVIAGVPLALRPGSRFHHTVGDYTNMGLVLLPSHKSGQRPRAAMHELAAAIRFDATPSANLPRVL